MTRAARLRNKKRTKGLVPLTIAPAIDLAIPPLKPNPPIRSIDPLRVVQRDQKFLSVLALLWWLGICGLAVVCVLSIAGVI